ncbi:MAG: 8-amino-7-oxononanoate synthase [Thermodesulfobacteriota bacterium]
MTRFIDEELGRIEAGGQRRAMRLVEGPQGARVTVGGHEALLLCSNDYLGLAAHPLLKEAMMAAVERYGAGAGASRLVSGNMEPHRELEERIRGFKSAEAALLFNSGYNANLGCITALSNRETEIFSDRLNHASIVDACRLSRARVKRYPNRDVDSLERLLKRSTARRRIIVTDGVFSMDGTIAPLKETAALSERFGATLIIDDAHATGVLGATGAGTLEHLGMEAGPSIIQMGTLGKALGSFGAFIAGSRRLVELLISRARPFIFTTALPPAVCAASSKAIEIVQERPELVERLRENARFFRDALAVAGIEVVSPEGETPIIPVAAGDPAKAMRLSERLLDAGVFIQAIRPPTVPEGTARLRATVTAAHTKAELRRAVDAIKGAVYEERG